METIVYKVTLTKYNNRKRNNETYCADVKEDSSLYTSKNKAADRARSLASCVFPDLVFSYYKAFENGTAKGYDDYMVAVDEYQDFEGKLNFVDRHYLMESRLGKVFNYEQTEQFFNCI